MRDEVTAIVASDSLATATTRLPLDEAASDGLREGVDESVPLIQNDDECTHDSEYARDWAHLPWRQRPSVYFLLPPFSLFALAFGGIAVPRINIIISLICRAYISESLQVDGHSGTTIPALGGSGKQCQSPEVQAIVSRFTLGVALVSGIISAFTSPRLGSLSDRYGRRYFMAASGLGLFSSEIVTILATKYSDTFSIKIFFVGAVLDGLCGSFMLGMALSYSYGADCTAPRRRAMVFGAFQGCFFLGIAVGPILGGLLVEATGNFLSVFYVALCLHAFFVLYVVGFLPESLSKRRMTIAREKHERAYQDHGAGKGWWESVNPINLVLPLGILFPVREGASPRLRLNLLVLAAIDTIILGTGIGSITVVIMYSEKTFGWENLQSSEFVSIVNSTRVIMLFLAMPIIITVFRRGKKLSANLHRGSDMLDIRLIQFSVLIEAIGYSLYAIAPSGALFTAAGACTALGGLASPIVQSSLTKHIPGDKTGQLLGATALLHSLAKVAAPATFNLIYAATVGKFPQAVFVCLGTTFGLAFFLSWFIRPHLYLAEEEIVPDVHTTGVLAGGHNSRYED